MAHFIAGAIREHVLNGDTDLANHKALLAAVDYCEQIRGGAATYPDDIADEIEHVIADELGIKP